MIESVEIADAEGTRHLDRDGFPVALGGVGAAIELPGVAEGETLAWIALADGELFLEAAGPGDTVALNGAPVAASQWLRDGDVIRVASTRITVRSGDRLRLDVEQVPEADITEPPEIVARESSAPVGTAVRPIEFTPRPAVEAAAGRMRIRPRTVLIWALVALLAATAWLVFTIKPVKIVVAPTPDRVEIEGSALGWEVSGRRLLRPGHYMLVAEKEGYRRLDAEFEVTRDTGQTIRFSLTQLPGVLVVDASGVVGAAVVVDGRPVGVTPLEPLELEPGDYVVRVDSPRHEPFEADVNIEGGGVRRRLDVTLLPLWAVVSFDSAPPGASVRIAGGEVGRTPVTTELLGGTHRYELSLGGYKTHRGTIQVVPRQPKTLPRITLQRLDAKLTIISDPAEASVTVEGEYRGRTPLELQLAPGRTHRIRLTRPGHDPASREVRLEAGETEAIDVVLPPRTGKIEIVALPAGAELVVDGQPLGPANRVLTLVAVPHRIEVRKEGYEPFTTNVTPRPGFPQSIEVILKTTEELEAEARPSLMRSPQGHRMVLIEGGRFRTGAPRREPGRRANEVVREIELQRPYYLSTTEVTNEEFHEFKSAHRSGRVGQHNLEIGHHPVVRVTWSEAARYCNWLSKKDSLPPVYLETGGELVAVDPISTGYRLPTEAEWVWAARYSEGPSPLKYPWGSTLPIPQDAGNYADQSADGLVSPTRDQYDDQFPATAPVDSFRPNALGLFNIGGNVAEWVHDIYAASATGDGKVEKDPVGPRRGADHVIRGSSWMDASVSELRLSYRDSGGRRDRIWGSVSPATRSDGRQRRMRVLTVLLFMTLLVATPAAPQGEESTGDSEGASSASAQAEEALEEFVPTEELSADSAISFPVDI